MSLVPFDHFREAQDMLERSLLGGCLLNPDMFRTVRGLVTAEHFVQPSHEAIWRALEGLDDQKLPIDQALLLERLTGVVTGPANLLSELMNAVPTSALTREYAESLDEAYRRRLLGRAAQRLMQRCRAAQEPLSGLLGSIEQEVRELRGEQGGGMVRADGVLEASVKDAEQAQERRSETGIKTPYGRLNELTGGLRPGEIFIVAARTSQGKSAFTLNLAHHAATLQGAPVLLFSLEMNAARIADRILGIETGGNTNLFRDGGMGRMTRLPEMREAARRVKGLPYWVCDSSSLNQHEIAAEIRRFCGLNRRALVLIDYLQLIHVQGKFNSRWEAVGEVTRTIKMAAVECRCPIVLVCQLSRAAEQVNNPYNLLTKLRESGNIEQDADVVLFLTSPNKKTMEQLSRHPDLNLNDAIQATVAKNREGQQGQFVCLFERTSQRIRPLEERYEPQYEPPPQDAAEEEELF